MSYPVCWKCGDPCKADELCRGCRSYFCEDCQPLLEMFGPTGSHAPSDHFDTNEEEDN